MDERIVKELRICDGNFTTLGKNASHLLAELKKNRKKIRGLRFGVILLAVSGLVLASELAERKRCENYLKAEIDELKTKFDDIECRTGELENDVGKLKIDGGAADA